MTEQDKNDSAFRSINTLIERWKEGTFGEIVDDWRWIFSYSKKYKGAILFYTLMGIISTSLGLVSSVASKYLIDIVTGFQKNKLALLLVIMIGSSLFSLLLSSVISRISARLSIFINNDIPSAFIIELTIEITISIIFDNIDITKMLFL